MRNIRLGTMGIASVYFVKWKNFRVHYSRQYENIVVEFQFPLFSSPEITRVPGRTILSYTR
jgi:hypothetical protein